MEGLGGAVPIGSDDALLGCHTRAMKIASLLFLPFLAACASTTGVLPLGENTYSVMRSDYGPTGNLNDVKAQAYKDAATFCAAQSKKVNVLSTTGVPRALAQFPEAEVKFSCV
jgi:hypothetical protein